MPQGLAIATVDVSFPLLAPNGSAAAPSYSFAANTANGMFNVNNNQIRLTAGGHSTGAFVFQYGNAAGDGIGIASDLGGIYLGVASDANLVRDAANVLAQRNGTTAQALRVYNTYTDAGNYERALFAWNANELIVGTDGLGTGSTIRQMIAQAGRVSFRLQGASVAWYFDLDNTGALRPLATGALDLGVSAARVRSIYLGGNTPAASAPMIDCSQTWNDAGVTFIGAKIVITDTLSAAGSKPWQILGGGAGATNLLYVTGAGDLVSGGSITAGNPFYAPDGSSGSPSYAFTGDTNTGFWRFGSGRIAVEVDGADILAFRVDGDVQVAVGSIFGWNPASNFNNAPDLGLARLAAASLRLGLAPSATPVNQTFTVGEFSRGGTDNNVAGADGTIRSGSGTGNAAGSSLFFDTPTVGASGTVQQSYGHRLTLSALGATFDIPDQGLRINNQVNGAGASAGTLTNAPSAGNPNFWLPISIAGTVRFCPLW